MPTRSKLLVNGETVRPRCGSARPIPSSPVVETTYVAGELVAVAYRNGTETGRVALVSPTVPVLLDVQVDRTRIDATNRDLAFVEIALVDADGNVHGEDRSATVWSTAGGAPGLRQRQPAAPMRPSGSLDGTDLQRSRRRVGAAADRRRHHHRHRRAEACETPP